MAIHGTTESPTRELTSEPVMSPEGKPLKGKAATQQRILSAAAALFFMNGRRRETRPAAIKRSMASDALSKGCPVRLWQSMQSIRRRSSSAGSSSVSATVLTDRGDSGEWRPVLWRPARR